MSTVPAATDPAALVAAGIGCRRGCPAEEIVAVVERAQADAGCRASLLAAPDLKAAEPGIHAAAARLALPLHLVAAPAMAAMQAFCATRSETVRGHVGIASVAEAAALAAAGEGARLLLPRIASARATCALAVAAPR